MVGAKGVAAAGDHDGQPKGGEVAQGKEIAGRLFLGETTVKTHVARILAKVRLRDRVQAVVFAYESGLVRPGG